MATTRRFWSRGKGTIAAIAGGLGITGATVWGIAVTAGKTAANQYVTDIVRIEYAELARPVIADLAELKYADSCTRHDVRLIRLMLEESIDGDTRQRAINRMNEPWRVR